MVVPLRIPAIVASHAGVWQADEAGNFDTISRNTAVRALADRPHLILNAAQLGARLGLAEIAALDLLELWAFVYPARFLVPSAKGLAEALDLEAPASSAAEAAFLQLAAAKILSDAAQLSPFAAPGARESLDRLTRKNWIWCELLDEAIGRGAAAAPLFATLPEWEEAPPRTPPEVRRFADTEIREALKTLAGERREPREGQIQLSITAANAFQPRETKEGPNLVVAEAGTGIGKTLAYLAPSALYTQETGGTVWLSTFTRALQRQLKAEASRSLPGMMRRGEIVVRKGRENYLCLLNLEDALQGSFSGRPAIFAELVARWARHTADGDMVGGDLPGWLPGLFRHGNIALPALTDRRGECIRSACPHYRRCFIEKSVREGQKASLVIANHALVMANAVRARAEGQGLSRLVFDEGHHLHAAADSAFSIGLTGAETIEFRRWLLGPDRPGRKAGRRRGLAARLMDLSSYDPAGGEALEELLETATLLPGPDWLSRLGANEPEGPIEGLLAAVRQHVLQHATDEERGYTLETPIVATTEGLAEAIQPAAFAFSRLGNAIKQLTTRLEELVKENPEWIDQASIARLTAAAEGLATRQDQVGAWQKLLERLTKDPDPDYVDWFTLIRAEGRELDCGVLRHWLDPLKPLAGAVLRPAHGVLVTSATLGHKAEVAAGAQYLDVYPRLFRAKSPFDYPNQARIWIATDVDRRNMSSLAHAYAALIEAAGGGTLGLFTAIARLRAVHNRVADRLARAGLPLFAQHVDAVDTGTLVDLFRADHRATLFGTDALRDGVDVPGDSLRLLIFEGVPWSRPTILHAARRAAYGGASYEDEQVRHRLSQAFGRLIRSANDKGGFVLLGASVPSRLLSAFPEGVEVRRLPLEQVVAEVRMFLGGANPLRGSSDDGAGGGDCQPDSGPLGLF